MAWAFVGVSGAVTATTNNITLTEPAGVQSGDLLVACIAYRSAAGGSNFTLPSGWALVATERRTDNTSTTTSSSIGSGLMAYIVRGGSAPALAFTRTAGANVAFGRIVAYRGQATSSPYDTGSASTLAANSATVTTTGITTAEAGELLVAAFCGADNTTASAFDAATDPATASGATDTTTAPTNGTWIERADSNTASGADTALAIGDAVRATAGATGTLQVTAGNSSRHVLIVGAFKVDLSQSVTGVGFADDDAFGDNAVTTAYDVTGAGFSDADAFGAAVVSQGGVDQNVTGAGFADADAFGAATVAASNAITGAGFADADAFGAAAVTATYAVTGAGFADGDAFGAASVAASYSITGAGFSDADAFGGASVAASYAITGAGFADADAFGANVVVLDGGDQSITGAGFADDDAFGVAVVETPTIVLRQPYYRVRRIEDDEPLEERVEHLAEEAEEAADLARMLDAERELRRILAMQAEIEALLARKMAQADAARALAAMERRVDAAMARLRRARDEDDAAFVLMAA